MTWRDHAACLGAPVDLFFPGKGRSASAAKEICATCRVESECAAWAAAQPRDLPGVWGGLSGRDRRRMGIFSSHTPELLAETPRLLAGTTVSNTATARRLRWLLTAGWTASQIGRLAGVSSQTVSAQLRPATGKVDAGVADLIAGLPERPPSGHPLRCAVCDALLRTHPLEGHLV